MLSTEPIAKRRSSSSIAASTPYQPPRIDDMREAAAQAVEQAVARPDLAGDLLVIESIGDIGVRMLGDDARQPADQRASAIGGDAAREVEGPVAPIRARTTWLGSVCHFGVVSFGLAGVQPKLRW